MDAMLQRHCARYIYIIPDGLRELMSDISREVLRSQPEDTYTFIADYLDALMITRENARVAARIVQNIAELATTTAIFLEETGMPRDEVDNVIAAVQKIFRRSIDADFSGETDEEEGDHIVSDVLAEIQISPEKANIAASIIQHAYRKFKERKEREKELLSGIIDWRVAARSAIHFYRKTGVSNQEANRAATLIKAAYKGYYTRKAIKQITETERLIGEGLDYKPPVYHIDLEEEIEAEDEEDTIHKRSVKIDYSTVKHHVDFDTDHEQPVAPPEQGVVSDRVSTASSIAKYSLKHVFDTAFERIGRQSTILEEEKSNEDVEHPTTADLVEQTTPVVAEVEIRHEDLDVADADESAKELPQTEGQEE